MAATTNAAGRRILQMWAAGTCTRAQLDNAYYVKGWISDADYAEATAIPEESEPTP